MHLKDANLYITENAITSLSLRGQIIIYHPQNERDFILSLTITMEISYSLRNNVCTCKASICRANVLAKQALVKQMFSRSEHWLCQCTQLSMAQKIYNNKKENDKQ